MASISEASNQLARTLNSALAIDMPYADRLAPHLEEKLKAGSRAASVLVIFGFSQNDEEPSILFTRRTELVETHKGQMAFPGGMSEPEEISQGEFSITALRETEEEVGIPRSQIQLIGSLPKLLTVTSFEVTPFVGILKEPISDVKLQMSESEIAEAVWIPMRTLLSDGVYRQEFLTVGQVRYPIHVYLHDSYRIWGVTASMTKNLMDRIGRVR